MNRPRMNSICTPYDGSVSSMLALLLCLLVCPALANGMGGEDVEAGEPPIVQVWIDERRSDLPLGTSLITPTGWFVNNGFPALSADRSQIAIMYKTGHPEVPGYPTFEIHSTASLKLHERIELVPEAEAEQILDLRDPGLLLRIEGILDDINGRLSGGGFRPMDTLFKLERYYSRLEGLEKFGMRIDYPSKESPPSLLTITSVSTGEVELEMAMPRGVEAYGPEGHCGWGGNPRQAWYEPELRIMILQMDFSTSIHGCEQPERWFLKRL